MTRKSVVLGIHRLWPRLFLFGVFTVLAVARSLGEQEVRVGPVVPDVSLWWFVVAGAGAFFVSPTSDFELRRDGLFGLTLALMVMSAFLWTWLKEGESEAPAKAVTVYHAPETGMVEEREVVTASLTIRDRRQLRTLAGRRRVVAMEVAGYLRVPESGLHRFEGHCVSRCTLRVGNETLLDGAGSSSAAVELESGVQRFWLRYERGGAPAFLKLSWDRPGFLELVPLDAYVSHEVGLLLDDTRGRRELSSALWVLQGAAWWLGVLCLVLWSGGKARGRFVVDRGPDGQPLPDGAHLAPNVLRTGALLLLYTSLATAHVFMVVRLIGPGPLLRGDRLVQDDYSYHLSSVIRVREFFVESGRLWGYSPELMAGFPAGTLDSTSNRAAESAVALLRWLPAAQAFALFLAGLFLVPPLLSYGSTRALGLAHQSSLVAAVLATLLFYGFLHGRSAYIRWGMYSHAVILVLAPLVAAAFFWLFQKPGWARAALAGLGLGFGTSVHILFPLVVAPAVVGAAIPMVKRADRSWVLYASISVVLGFLVNLHWIVPFLEFRDSIAQVPMLGHFPGGPATLVARALSWTYALQNVVCLVGLAGLPSFARERGSMAAACSATGAAGLLFLGTAGSSLPIVETIEPGRFLDGVAFFLLPAAADATYRWLSGRKDRLAVAVGVLLVVAYPSLRNWAQVVGPEGRGAFIVWDEDW